MSKKSKNEGQINRFVFQKALVVGISGGVFWTLVWMFLYFFHLVGVSPFIIWEKLFHGAFTFDQWYMKILGIVLNGILSMVLAIIYFACFKKVKHWMMGVGYGIIIWLISYLLIPIVLFNNHSFFDGHTEKHIGLLSLLVLYGLFIGYTISFDYDHFHGEAEE